jgi:hypothetical protein
VSLAGNLMLFNERVRIAGVHGLFLTIIWTLLILPPQPELRASMAAPMRASGNMSLENRGFRMPENNCARS